MPHFQDMTPESRRYEVEQIPGHGADYETLRDSQVKGRVVTTLTPDATGWQVKQQIDGTTVTAEQFTIRPLAAEQFVTLRAHARRNLHEYLSSVRPESSYRQQEA